MLIEQRRIADYLDAETGRIDRALDIRRHQVEALSRRRQALIDLAVDPVAGAGWPGMPAKRLIDGIEQGWSPQCDSRPAEPGEWGVLKAGAANGGVFRQDENKALPADSVARGRIRSQSRGPAGVARKHEVARGKRLRRAGCAAETAPVRQVVSPAPQAVGGPPFPRLRFEDDTRPRADRGPGDGVERLDAQMWDRTPSGSCGFRRLTPQRKPRPQTPWTAILPNLRAWSPR